ncbi:hypothetical protein NPIL_124251 [Nephila pilipes]|uniref:Uncharacterized protein n=1 Tax=Nephila pilipes TaxID=299642 RepID=A0A8X6NNB2_NEPPI|nr:hypothetical protein NPIL_124251 [Nephila pilipes]
MYAPRFVDCWYGNRSLYVRAVCFTLRGFITPSVKKRNIGTFCASLIPEIFKGRQDRRDSKKEIQKMAIRTDICMPLVFPPIVERKLQSVGSR